MRLTDLELDLIYSLVDFASSKAYADSYGTIYFEDDTLYIDRSIMDNYTSVDDFKTACDLLMEKLARG